MAYLRINQIKELYDISDKTIRRLYEKNKSNPSPPITSRSQGYKNKKGKWVISEDFLESRFADKKIEPDQAETKSDPSQTKTATNSDQALLKTIEVLQEQLREKDRQLERYDQKLDQQQKLTAQLQNQLLIASPTEPIRATEQAETPKAQPKPKKPTKQAQKSPQSKKKATKPKKKRWWQKG